MLYLDNSFLWHWKLKSLKYKSEVPLNIWNVLLEKEGNQLDRLCGTSRSITKSQAGNKHPTYNKKNERCFLGHILRSNSLLKHDIELKIEGTRKCGRRREYLLNSLMEKRQYCNLKEGALDRILWRTHFGRGCGSVARKDM